MNSINEGNNVSGFKIEKVEQIREIKSDAVLCRHQKTGARLLHIANDDPNNLFCIGFRTPVNDNTGVAHILEHSVLSGSRKYPLKDPFKELLKGSLQTFLNAITFPDKTIYPVSSQVEADYFNLIDVYCDAVFYPLLEKETFYQEGWHFDLKKGGEKAGIKGIVYNEMKGVFSDFRNHVSRKTLSDIFPDTTYYYESGGDPESITDLAYNDFKAFHRKYYHPSNSFIILFGNIPTEKTISFLDERYLSGFDSIEVNSEIKPQNSWKSARKKIIKAPSSEDDRGKASVVVSWLFGSSADPLTRILGIVFERYLLEMQASPLRKALLESGFGEDLEDVSGYEKDLVQGIFSAGLRRADPSRADDIEKLIISTVKKQSEGEIDSELLEGALKQTEFSLREIKDSGSIPYSIILANRCYGSWIYNGDPLAHLKIEKHIEKIKNEKKKGTGFFEKKLEELFVNNPHRLLSVVTASPEMGKKLESQTEEQARRLCSGFSEEDKEECVRITERLDKRQREETPQEVLDKIPVIKLGDIPRENIKTPVFQDKAGEADLFGHALFTSGIVYLDAGFDLSVIPKRLLPYWPLFGEVVTRCGAAGISSDEMARRISLSMGGFSYSDMCSCIAGDHDRLAFYGFFHGKSLPANFQDMTEIMSDLFTKPELKDRKLLKEVLLEMRNSFNASVIQSGHNFAVRNASASFTRGRSVIERIDGISQLRFLQSLIQEDCLDDTIKALSEIHKLIINRSGCLFSLTCADPEKYKKPLEVLCEKLPLFKPVIPEIKDPELSGGRISGIEINSSVNYVARSWRTGSLTAEDVGILMMMSRNLSTGYLWERVRVAGGAYGGMALASESHPVFSFCSYRDPNLSVTLDNFKKALEYLSKGLDRSEVKKSIIGAIGKYDKPMYPHKRGLHETMCLLSGKSPEYRQRIREAILNVDSDNISDYADKFIHEHPSAVTVIGSPTAFDRAQEEGIKIIREKLLNA